MKGSFCGSTEDFLPGSGTEAATGSSGIVTNPNPNLSPAARWRNQSRPGRLRGTSGES